MAKEFLAIELENAVARAETAEHALMGAQTELTRLRVETEQWKNRYQQTALTDSRLKVCEADLARVTAERDAATAELERIRNYNPYAATACPMCKYKDGVFVEPCAYHKDGEKNDREAVKPLEEALVKIQRGDYDNAHDCLAASKVAALALATAAKLGLTPTP